MTQSQPIFSWSPSSALRLWTTGNGPLLLVLPGLLKGPATRADEVAASFPGWTVASLELPGLGASATGTNESPDRILDVLTHWLASMEGHVNVIAFDMAGPLADRLGAASPRLSRIAWVGREKWERFVKLRLRVDGLSPVIDGSHLVRLWSHIRERDVLDADDSRRARTSGDPYVTPDELEEVILTYGATPQAYERLWNECVVGTWARVGSPSRVRTFQSVVDAAGWICLPEGAPKVRSLLPEPPGNTPVLTRQYVTVSRGRIHLRRGGNAPRLLLVFMAGPGSSWHMEPVIEAMQGEFTVVAPDYLGQGDSPRAPQPTNMQELARDAAEIAEQLGFETYWLYGAHTGVGVAIELAIAEPQRVQRVILDGGILRRASLRVENSPEYFPDISPDPWGIHLIKVWNMRRDAGLWFPWFKPEAAYAKKTGSPNVTSLHDRVICSIRSRTTPAYQVAIRSYEVADRLPRITVPTLFVAGPKDVFISELQEARRIAPANVQFKDIPGTIWSKDDAPEQRRETRRIFMDFLLARDEASAARGGVQRREAGR